MHIVKVYVYIYTHAFFIYSWPSTPFCLNFSSRTKKKNTPEKFLGGIILRQFNFPLPQTFGGNVLHDWWKRRKNALRNFIPTRNA